MNGYMIVGRELQAMILVAPVAQCCWCPLAHFRNSLVVARHYGASGTRTNFGRDRCRSRRQARHPARQPGEGAAAAPGRMDAGPHTGVGEVGDRGAGPDGREIRRHLLGSAARPATPVVRLCLTIRDSVIHAS